MSKILLVEDNEMNRDMLSRRLQRKGCEITDEGPGAQQAIEATGPGCFTISPAR